MSIQVYERFDRDRGELWETITCDLAAPAWRDTTSGKLAMGWRLRCDFRMPAHGILRFMNPVRDEAVEFSYDTPTCLIPHYTPGVIKQKSFTPELKLAWDALPFEWSCQVGAMTLICRRDIVDAVEASPLGELYPYRAVELRLA